MADDSTIRFVTMIVGIFVGVVILFRVLIFDQHPSLLSLLAGIGLVVGCSVGLVFAWLEYKRDL